MIAPPAPNTGLKTRPVLELSPSSAETLEAQRSRSFTHSDGLSAYSEQRPNLHAPPRVAPPPGAASALAGAVPYEGPVAPTGSGWANTHTAPARSWSVGPPIRIVLASLEIAALEPNSLAPLAAAGVSFAPC